MNDGLLLILLTFLPTAGALVLFALRHRSALFLRAWTVTILLLNLCLTLFLWFRFPNPSSVVLGETMMAIETKHLWFQLDNLSIFYHLGIDGLSLVLILLTTALSPMVLLVSWDEIQEKIHGFCSALLLMQTGILGVLMALDLFLFLLFWEFLLIPMYFLIGIWGGTRRVYAAVKFLLHNMVGSALMFLAILYLGLHCGSLNILQLYHAAISPPTQQWLFLCFALAFLIRTPIFPFHTWLTDALTESSAVGSILIAGILLKLGTYSFFRLVMPIFPHALQSFTQPLMILAIFGIVYGAWIAMIQTDLKSLVVYACFSQMGLIMLGLLCLNVQSLQGSLLHMFNHGWNTAALLLVMTALFRRRQSHSIPDYGGIAQTVPVLSFFLFFFGLAWIGLPGFHSFVSEMLIMLGAFGTNKVYAIVAGSAMIWGAVYMFWMIRRILFGPIIRAENYHLEDLNRREFLGLTILAVVMLWVGFYPTPWLQKTAPVVNASIRHIQEYKSMYSQVPKITESRRKFP